MIEPTWECHCVDRAAEHYHAVTGTSLWAKSGVKAPRNAKQTAAVFRVLGVRTLKAALSKVLGKPVRPAFAMRGDLVMVDNAVGICRGEWVEMIDRMQPISRAECAWRIT